MSCSRATQLIHLEIDTRLSPADAAALQSHLRACRRCRAYQLGLTTTLAALRADADSLARQTAPSPAYRDALRHRLLEADRAIAARPLAAAERLLVRVTQVTSFVPIEARRALAVAALFLVLTLASATHVLRPADPPLSECRLGHMPSFRVRVTQNGRVYASLASQTALSRRACEEALP